MHIPNGPIFATIPSRGALLYPQTLLSVTVTYRVAQSFQLLIRHKWNVKMVHDTLPFVLPEKAAAGKWWMFADIQNFLRMIWITIPSAPLLSSNLVAWAPRLTHLFPAGQSPPSVGTQNTNPGVKRVSRETERKERIPPQSRDKSPLLSPCCLTGSFCERTQRWY